MFSATLISGDEYLATGYRPDREFNNGQLQERNVGEFDHSNLQRAPILWIGNREREWNVRVLPEQRIRVAPGRILIPDICIISRAMPIEPVFTSPPLACIEILSKDDSLRSIQERVDEYRAFGIANVWILDPVTRHAYICTAEGFREASDRRLTAAGSPLEIRIDEVFAFLD